MDENGERYDRSDIERIFKNTILDKTYARLLADPGLISPKGTEIAASVLFSDIRGATLLQQELGIEAFAGIIQKCLEISERAVVNNMGFLDKFVGDETMATFGVPFGAPPSVHAAAACRTALAIRDGYEALGVKVGVGVNTGKMVFGNIGTRANPNYSPMGDEVNFGARLEGATKAFGWPIAIGEDTAEAVRGRFRVVPTDALKVKGLSGTRRVFALLGEESSMNPEDMRFWDEYEAAYLALDEGEIRAPLATLERLAKAKPENDLLRFAYERATKNFAESSAAAFASATDLPALAAALASAWAEAFPGSELGLLAPSEDGTWRFLEHTGLSAPPVVLSADGDILAWLRGIEKAAWLADGPSPLVDLPYALAAPLRRKNELVAALFAGAGDESSALGVFAEKLAGPFAELRLSAYKERFREKASAEERLAKANWELEAQSLELQKALSDIKSLNTSLEERVKGQVERLERAFKLKRYLPPELVEAVLEGRKHLEPSFERRKITVMFSDVQGFTAATESLEPEELARLLNEYLSTMSDIAFRWGGTIDKFRGDGMMVLFGAPERLDPAESARRCAGMAVDMCRATESLKAKWDDEGYDWDIGIRVGINTGYATVGEFGCEERMDYTAIGTEVNLASRLETACEVGGITLSHASYAHVKESYPCEPRGEVQLKGIARPIRIYELLWREARAG
jgi:class 3 adenylate cyclase